LFKKTEKGSKCFTCCECKECEDSEWCNANETDNKKCDGECAAPLLVADKKCTDKCPVTMGGEELIEKSMTYTTETTIENNSEVVNKKYKSVISSST